LEAKAHWERFLPNLAAELRRPGPDALNTAIRKAYWTIQYRTAVDRLKNQDLHDLLAQEAHRTVLFPPPESTDGFSLRRKLLVTTGATVSIDEPPLSGSRTATIL
jgi:hypothetical protein